MKAFIRLSLLLLLLLFAPSSNAIHSDQCEAGDPTCGKSTGELMSEYKGLASKLSEYLKEQNNKVPFSKPGEILTRKERMARLLERVEGTYDMKSRDTDQILDYMPISITIEKDEDGFYRETREFLSGRETEFRWKADGIWRGNVKTFVNDAVLIHLAKVGSNETIDAVTYGVLEKKDGKLTARVSLEKGDDDYGVAYYFTPNEDLELE